MTGSLTIPKQERITAHRLQRKFGSVRRAALTAPVIVTHHGKDDMVLMPAERCAQLVRHEPVATYAHGTPDYLVEALDSPLEPTDAARFVDEADGGREQGDDGTGGTHAGA